MFRTIATLVLTAVVVAWGSAHADDGGKNPKITWEKNAQSAYQKAVEQKKPLVIAFLCPPSDEKCLYCKDFRSALHSDEFNSLAGKAVFVIGEIATRNGNRSEDEGAQLLFGRLQCKSTPVVSVMEPNPKMLAEILRLEGTFNSKDLTRHVRDGINKWVANPSLTMPQEAKQP